MFFIDCSAKSTLKYADGFSLRCRLSRIKAQKQKSKKSDVLFSSNGHNKRFAFVRFFSAQYSFVNYVWNDYFSRSVKKQKLRELCQTSGVFIRTFYRAHIPVARLNVGDLIFFSHFFFFYRRHPKPRDDSRGFIIIVFNVPYLSSGVVDLTDGAGLFLHFCCSFFITFVICQNVETSTARFRSRALDHVAYTREHSSRAVLLRRRFNFDPIRLDTHVVRFIFLKQSCFATTRPVKRIRSPPEESSLRNGSTAENTSNGARKSFGF